MQSIMQLVGYIANAKSILFCIVWYSLCKLYYVYKDFMATRIQYSIDIQKIKHYALNFAPNIFIVYILPLAIFIYIFIYAEIFSVRISYVNKFHIVLHAICSLWWHSTRIENIRRVFSYARKIYIMHYRYMMHFRVPV